MGEAPPTSIPFLSPRGAVSHTSPKDAMDKQKQAFVRPSPQAKYPRPGKQVILLLQRNMLKMMWAGEMNRGPRPQESASVLLAGRRPKLDVGFLRTRKWQVGYPHRSGFPSLLCAPEHQGLWIARYPTPEIHLLES